MSLLTHLVEDSLDQGYARAAARRTAGEEPRRGPPVLLAVGLVAVGLLLATAALQARERAPTSAQARAALIAQIEDRQGANDRLEQSLVRQRVAVSRARRQGLRLTEQGSALSRTLTRLESVTGVSAVVGPGMRIRLHDAPEPAPDAQTDPRSELAGEGRVTDRDLQTVVNEVWAAGAEAVAVNGQRMTALSAIRAAGDAILVDFRPLAPPYHVAALGPGAMRVRFVSGFGGSYLEVLRDYGITNSVEDEPEIRLPASAGVTLRHARPTDALGSAARDGRQG
jgi:uncharacterized protein YlxW (UPF0749 family)